MLVFGDPWRIIDLVDWRARAAAPLPGDTWIARHSALTSRLIEAGQVLQALQDADFHEAGGKDRENPRLAPLLRHVASLARGLVRSSSDPARIDPPPADLTGKIRAREPEGYAFYGLYPEAYAQAARPFGPDPDALVIGLRSIGASLGPVVGAALGTEDVVTLRPQGPPFERRIEAPDLRGRLLAKPPCQVAIVDEGPGLSGSSFTSVASFVRSVSPQSRIRLFPGHAGAPGAMASPETRALYQTLPRHVIGFDDLLRERLPAWVADMTGPALAPLEDVSGGAWRARAYASETEWPASDTMQERRKFLVHAARGCFLLKFIGLGDIGERKARIAAALSAAGLAPEVLGYRHGFLVERWRDDARPLDPLHDRPAIVPAIARYLAFRQRHFACPDAFSATPAELREMAVHNVSLAMGDAAGETVGRKIAPLLENATRLRRIASDNRMHAHEWLIAANGAILKTDGADHHAGHDLMGAQDVIHDVAAASLEFDLTAQETFDLCRALASDSGTSVARDLLAPMRMVWLAFELGRATLALSTHHGNPEAPRLQARRKSLTMKLKRELAAPAS